MILGGGGCHCRLEIFEAGESSLGKRWGWEEVAVIMAGAAVIIVGLIKEKEPKMKKCTCQWWHIDVDMLWGWLSHHWAKLRLGTSLSSGEARSGDGHCHVVRKG